MKKFKKMGGFTLTELLLTIAIIGILSAIAVPSYRSYIVQARRSDAEQELTKLVSTLENCFALNNTYRDCLPNNDNQVLSNEVATYYDFSRQMGDNAYFISVTASRGTQIKDTAACQQLTINSLGRKFSGCTAGNCAGQGADVGHCW